MIKSLTSKWAIIPCSLLLVFTYALMGMAMIQADDFDRDMTLGEILLATTPIIPVSWLVLIIFSHIINLNNEKNSSKESLIQIMLASFILLCFVSYLFII